MNGDHGLVLWAGLVPWAISGVYISSIRVCRLTLEVKVSREKAVHCGTEHLGGHMDWCGFWALA